MDPLEEMRAVEICDCDHILGCHAIVDHVPAACEHCGCKVYHWSLRTTLAPREDLDDSPAPRRKRLPFRRVWDRDGWRCVRCGTHEDLTVDHIVPISKGGADDPDDISNLQTLCKSCNSSKGNRELCPGFL